MKYHIRKAETLPRLDGDWDGPAWRDANGLRVANVLPESSDHHPVTEAKLLYDAAGIYVIFRVQDRYVRCVASEYNGEVWKDSCVEFFVQPRPDQGYFNFEINCGGTLLSSYIEDPTRTDDGFKKFTRLPEEEGSAVRIYHSLPERVEPEANFHLPQHFQPLVFDG